MRDIIIARMKYLLDSSGAAEDINNRFGRWGGHWYDKDYNNVGLLSKNDFKNINPTHISNIDFDRLTESELVSIFESVVRKFYRMM